MSRKYNSVQFSADPYRLTRAFLADPETRGEVERAMADGPAATMTEQLGFGNLAEDGQPEEWHTLFPATRKEKAIGEQGLIMRAAKSKFALLRLRKQTVKPQQVIAAPAEETEVTITADNIEQVLASLDISKEQFLMLAAANYKPEASVSSEEVSDDAPTDKHVLPESVAAIIGVRR